MSDGVFRILLVGATSGLVLGGCSNKDTAEATMAVGAKEANSDGMLAMKAEGLGRSRAPASPAAAPPAEADMAMDRPKRQMANELAKSSELSMASEVTIGAGSLGGLIGGIGGEAEPPKAPRAWFPETFVWAPLLVTDTEGRGQLSAKIPDRLTTWRILALGHSRAGSLAAAEARFLGTLPVYVDPVVPAFLTAGDEVRLPIQVVNTTDSPVAKVLVVSVQGAVSRPLRAPIKLPPRGSALELVSLRADRAGMVLLKASLGAADSIERTFNVEPSGRPVRLERSGTLAAPRSFELEAPPDAEREGAKAVLTVLPGALALLKSELVASGLRGGVANDGYSLLLAGRASELLKALGAEVDAETLRTMKIVAMQRALRHARAPELDAAVLLAGAALAHPGDAVLERLGDRLVSTILVAQRPDGTFGGQTGYTLQRLLVITAEGARAVGAHTKTAIAKNRAQGARLRARGAFERYLGQVDDPFTAAVILSSGAVSGSMANTLLERVTKAIVTREDGSKVLPVPEGVVRSDGVAPSEVEATAHAALALLSQNADKLLAMDLGSALLSSYRPSMGWGDGRANLTCLYAVLELFKEPIPENVAIILEQGGVEVTRGTLSGQALREVLKLTGTPPRSAGKHGWTVRAEPPVPGLGFSLSVEVYVPWTSDARKGGLELKVSVGAASVGTKARIDVLATAPADVALDVEIPLPAAVSADEASLETLVSSGEISSFRVEDGKVAVVVPPREPGKLVSFGFSASPTLAGKLHAAAPSLAPSGRAHEAVFVAPPEWIVK